MFNFSDFSPLLDERLLHSPEAMRYSTPDFGQLFAPRVQNSRLMDVYNQLHKLCQHRLRLYDMHYDMLFSSLKDELPSSKDVTVVLESLVVKPSAAGITTEKPHPVLSSMPDWEQEGPDMMEAVEKTQVSASIAGTTIAGTVDKVQRDSGIARMHIANVVKTGRLAIWSYCLSEIM